MRTVLDEAASRKGGSGEKSRTEPAKGRRRPRTRRSVGGNLAASDKFLLTVSDVATMLSVCPRTLLRLVARGLAPRPVHLGDVARWRAKDVADYISKL